MENRNNIVAEHSQIQLSFNSQPPSEFNPKSTRIFSLVKAIYHALFGIMLISFLAQPCSLIKTYDEILQLQEVKDACTSGIIANTINRASLFLRLNTLVHIIAAMISASFWVTLKRRPDLISIVFKFNFVMTQFYIL